MIINPFYANILIFIKLFRLRFSGAFSLETLSLSVHTRPWAIWTLKHMNRRLWLKNEKFQQHIFLLVSIYSIFIFSYLLIFKLCVLCICTVGEFVWCVSSFFPIFLERHTNISFRLLVYIIYKRCWPWRNNVCTTFSSSFSSTARRCCLCNTNNIITLYTYNRVRF